MSRPGENLGRRSTDRKKPWHGRYLSFAGLVTAMLIAIIVFAGILVWAGAAIDEAKCDAYSTETGRETRYTFMVGCMMKVQDGWIQKEEFRQVQRLNP